MNKKIILVLFAFFAFAFNSSAQGISMIGDGVSGWSTDVDMTTSDGNIYTLSAFTFSSGGAKFRQDHAWTNNWGSGSFPSGTGNQNGANIPVTAGVYDVTFNKTTKAYTFTAAALGFANISVFGTANSSVDGDMSTTDGIHYSLDNYAVTLGDLVFRQDHAGTNTWGAVDFPNGTATSGGTAISVIPGTYDIRFNLTTGVYTFSFATVSVIGAAVGGWADSNDVNMTTTDGVNYSLNMSTFITGECKFRQNHAWAFNWGASAFPNGTASLNGSNVNVVGGDYVVAFNRVTGVYSFTSGYPVVSLYDGAADIDLTTFDGVNYFLNGYAMVAGNYQFRQAHANAFVWGASAFPSGTAATYLSTSIPVTGKRFNITFNKTTGAYAFTYVTIAIIGDATPGGWGADTDMSTIDGINYKINGVTLTNAFVKFRMNHDWSTNWGSSSYPSGVADLGGNNIGIPEGSIYNIQFNIETGDFSIIDTLLSRISNSQCGASLSALNSNINAVVIPGYQMYRFEVVNGATTYTYETVKYNFDLTKVPGSTYGTTYTVRVAIKLADAWRNYGAACTVTTPTLTTSAVVPTTQMLASQWNTTLATLSSPIHSKYMYNAQAYRFEVTNGAVVTTFETPIYYFNLTNIVGSTYNTTYGIRIAIKVDGIWGNYGASHNITSPAFVAPLTTKLLASFCGVTLPFLDTKIGATPVYGATGYRFEIITGGITTVYDSSAYNFKLSQAGVVVGYNTVYDIRVAALVNGVYGDYGTSCSVTTPVFDSNAIHTTTLLSSFCGATLAALDTKIGAALVSGANGYRFEITTGGITTVYDSATYNFKLSQAGVVVANATTYSIRVAALVNGIYANYGASCDVTTPAAAAPARLKAKEYAVTAYPNPFENNFSVSIEGTSNSNITINVYDMLGRQVENREVKAEELENISLGTNYTNGIYNVMITQGEITKVVRMIKK
jgi:hypothetical protein